MTKGGSLLACAGILKQSMEARNRVGIGLSYWPARLYRLAKLIPWNRFLRPLKVSKFGLCLLMLPSLLVAEFIDPVRELKPALKWLKWG